MTERKPAGLPFESWVDQQIRAAQERGDFDDLPGLGKPLPDLDEPYDELWWVRRKLAEEGLTFLPPTLLLRKEAEDALAAAADAASEAEVRRIVSDLNDKISRALREPTDGPPLNLAPFDIDSIVEEWRGNRPVEPDPPTATPAAEVPAIRRKPSFLGCLGLRRHRRPQQP